MDISNTFAIQGNIVYIKVTLCEQIGHEIDLVLVFGRDVVDWQVIIEQVESGSFVHLQNAEEVSH